MTRRTRNFERERNGILHSFRGGLLPALIHWWAQLAGSSPPLNNFYFLLGIDIHRPRQQGNRIVNIQSFAHIKGLACFHANQ
jgi:hypothetical protein